MWQQLKNFCITETFYETTFFRVHDRIRVIPMCIKLLLKLAGTFWNSIINDDKVKQNQWSERADEVF